MRLTPSSKQPADGAIWSGAKENLLVWFGLVWFKLDKEDFAFIFNLLARHKVSLNTTLATLKCHHRSFGYIFYHQGRIKGKIKIICHF